MKTRVFTMTALVAVATAMLADITSCKEDVQCEIPTVPTTTTLEDGAIIRDPNACFPNDDYFVSGSTIASDGSIYYNYYVGTSLENMEKYSDSDKCRLIPYTKYYWYAIARIGYPEDGESEPTPVRTFYYVPSFSANLETDNGENESAIVGHWKTKNSDGRLSNFRVSIEPETAGIKCDKNIVPISAENQDSCRFSILAGDDYVTHSQDWDDKSGVYYEPIKYKIRLEADVQFDDTVIDTHSETVEEIFLDKSKMVRDPQFNVYRVAKIGNYIWTLDNLRYITDNNSYEFILIKKDHITEYKEVALKSGEKGVLYNYWILDFSIIDRFLPKGFELASRNAWEDLLSAYGVADKINWQTVGFEHREGNDPYLLQDVKNGLIDRFAQNYESKHNDQQILEYYNDMNYDTTFYKYQSLDMFDKLRSQYGWYDTENGSAMEGEPTLFNAKPFGMMNGEDNYSINSAAFFFTPNGEIIGIWANNKGICLVNAHGFIYNPETNFPYSENWFFSVRGVKKIE